MRPTLALPGQRPDYAGVSKVDIRAAHLLGVQPKTVHQWRVGNPAQRPQEKVAALVRAALALEDDEAFAHIMAPIQAALDGVTPAELTADLVRRAQEADQEEDRAETAYRFSPTTQNLKRWFRTLRRQGTLTWKLLTAER